MTMMIRNLGGRMVMNLRRIAEDLNYHHIASPVVVVAHLYLGEWYLTVDLDHLSG
jgi:hypothetical protein